MGFLDKLLGKAAPGGPSKKRILVADDDADVRNLVTDLLQIEGYDVVQAHDGMEALAKLKKERFDLLITDVHMPRLEGPQLIKILRTSQEHKNQPIMVLSSEGMIATLNEVFELGALAYLPKPFQAHELISKVTAFFASR